MGAETPAITLMFFIVATSLAAGAATVLGTGMISFADGLSTRFTTLRATLESDVAIINDPGKVPVNPVLVYVKNIGARILEPSGATILFDGRYVNATAAIQNGATRWAPADVVRYTISTSELTVPAGDHVIRVIIEGGAMDELRFRST